MTRVLQPDYECDTFFPSLEESPQWQQASYEELTKWIGEESPDEVVVAERTEEKGATWEPQLWSRVSRE